MSTGQIEISKYFFILTESLSQLDFSAIQCYFLSMKPTIDLILHDDVKRLLDHFAAVMNLSIVLFNAKGEIIQRGLNRRNSDYCRLMQNHLFGYERCVTMDASKQRESIATRSTVCYRCHAGLREAIAPVMAEGIPAGFVLIGQFRTTRKLPAEVKRRCGEPQLSAAVEQAFEKLTYITPAKLDSLLGMFSLLIDYIVTKELVGLRRNRTLLRIEQYIADHVESSITLSEVARYVGKSSSTVSHLVKNKTGMTFKNMVIEHKLDRAEKLMKSNPEKTIEEIAGEIGYDDPFYFSRLYRKYRKITPSEYRRIMKGR